MMQRSGEITTVDMTNYMASEVLGDGSRILIRAIRADDKQRLLQHFQNLSPQSVYYRFFGLKRSLNDDDLQRFTELDFINHVGLAATLGRSASERFVGVGRYIRSEGASSAEVAFAVLDEYQGHGIGTLLLNHLTGIARVKGIKEFTASVLGSNKQMLEVFASSGFRVHDSYDSGVVRVSLEIGVRDRVPSERAEKNPRAEAVMKVEQMMNHAVKACHPEDSLNKAAQTMWENVCGAVPIVDAEFKPIGFLTDRDICMAAYTQGKPLQALTVDGAMARKVVCCQLEDDLDSAMQLMREKHFRRLPVVGPDGKLIGILSLDDLAHEAGLSLRGGVNRELRERVAEVCIAVSRSRVFARSPRTE